MKKLLTIFLLFISVTCSAQVWTNTGNTLQRTPTSKGYFYRFSLGSPGFMEFYTQQQIDSLFATVPATTGTLTDKSVLFAVGNKISQDNVNLYYDYTLFTPTLYVPNVDAGMGTLRAGSFQVTDAGTHRAIINTGGATFASDRQDTLQNKSGIFAFKTDITGGINNGNFTGLTLPGTTLQYVRGNGSLATLPASGVSSFNTRTGGVTSIVGDYSSFYPQLNATNLFTNGFSSQYSGDGVNTSYPNTLINNTSVTTQFSSTKAVTMQQGIIAYVNSGISGVIQWSPTSSNKTWTIPDATSTAVGTDVTQPLTNKNLNSGTNTFPIFNQNTTGSAASLTTARTISITGDLAYTSPSFDGTGNVTAAGTLATVNSNVGSFGTTTSIPSFTLNAKGLVTAASGNTISYQAPITLTTTGTSGAATLTGATLNIPQYSGGSTPTLQTVTTAGNTTTTNIGIGTTSPLAALHIATTSTSTPRGILSDQNTSDALGSRITMRKSRGTPSSPTVITSGDVLGTWTASGHDGTNYIDAGKIIVTSTGTIGTGIIPSTMQLQTMTSAGALSTGLTITPTLAQGTNLVATGSNQQEYYTALYFGNSITGNPFGLTGGWGASATVSDSDYVHTTSRGMHTFPDNRGVGGTIMSSVFTTVTVPYNNNNIKFVFVMFDSNEYNFQTPLNTYRVTVNALLDSLVTLRGYPKGKIILMTGPYNNIHRTIPMSSYTAITSAAASAKGITLVDNYTYMSSYASAHPTQVLLAPDTLHLTNLGHAVLANYIISQLSSKIYTAKGSLYADSVITGNTMNANNGYIRYLYANMMRPDTLYSHFLKTDLMVPGSSLSWGTENATRSFLTTHDDGTSSTRTGIGQNTTGAELVLHSYGFGSIGGMRAGIGNDPTTMTDANSTWYIDNGGYWHLNKIKGTLNWGNLNATQEYLLTEDNGATNMRTGIGMNGSGAVMVLHGYGTGGNGGMRFTIGNDVTTSTNANSFIWADINNVLNINNKYTLYGTSSGIITFKAQAAAGTYEWDWPTTAGIAGQMLTSQGGAGTAATWTYPNGTIVGTPTIAAGAGAGASPTVSVTSNGAGLQVTITTGSLPIGTNATIATVTLANALSYTPYPVFGPGNANTSLLSAASMVYMTSTGTANVTITSGTTALTAATTYIWNIKL